MTAIEVGLLLIGVVFLIGSFFVTEKLSQSEIGEIAKLSETELQTVIERELEIASAKVSDMVDDSVDLSLNKIQRSLDKETNDKMMAIQEYSDTVLKDLEKTNKEVTFLYSMLGDKHNELQDSIAKMNELTQECDELREQIKAYVMGSRQSIWPRNRSESRSRSLPKRMQYMNRMNRIRKNCYRKT